MRQRDVPLRDGEGARPLLVRLPAAGRQNDLALHRQESAGLSLASSQAKVPRGVSKEDPPAVNQATSDFRRAVSSELERIGFAGKCVFLPGVLHLTALDGGGTYGSELRVPEESILDLLDAVTDAPELFGPNFIAEACPACVLSLPERSEGAPTLAQIRDVLVDSMSRVERVDLERRIWHAIGYLDRLIQQGRD